MLQSSENSFNPKSGSPASNPNAYNPVKTVTAPSIRPPLAALWSSRAKSVAPSSLHRWPH